MSDAPAPQRKSELIARIREGRAALDALVAGLTPEQAALSGPDGGWSVKDHLAHLAAWQCVAYLRLIGHSNHEHEVFGMDRARYEVVSNADVLNEAVYRASADRTLAEVRASFEQAYQQVLNTIASLQWDALQQLTDSHHPQLGTLAANVAGNTYEHFTEHSAWIQRLLRSRGIRA